MDLNLKRNIVVVVDEIDEIVKELDKRISTEFGTSCDIVILEDGKTDINRKAEIFDSAQGLVNFAKLNKYFKDWDYSLPILSKGNGPVVNVVRESDTIDVIREAWSRACLAFGMRVNTVLIECETPAPEKIADAVIFLLSERSRAMNGQSVRID